ncbi:cytokine receptor common subunit gamma-like isoform X1 [Acanthochromis polyacanthus]|uniref:cytokine receptor common subunit gamma-like isoform X1 n=1 Tax=Acanthochromis polyacanthus TaxID=80966 RepID=UPI002233F53A|nr:cytokine receptor common subunit gamma-like isoform X1 [Acanthochromis polyacanthus]
MTHRCRSSPNILFLSPTMSTSLLLFLCLVGHAFAEKPPDVDCLVVHLQHVHCSWNQKRAPEVNYTFSSWFHHEKEKECATYLSENGVITGCYQPYQETKRFNSFYTTLVHGNKTFLKTHELKNKVKLNPPSNVTVKNGSDSNLWFYWNQTKSQCVESEVRYKINDRTEQRFPVSNGVQSYGINLPSSSSRYELQVRSRVDDTCGQSIFWSDWSEPVVWGSNSHTVSVFSRASACQEAGFYRCSLCRWLPPSLAGLLVLCL